MKITIDKKTIAGALVVGAGVFVLNNLTDKIYTSNDELYKLISETNQQILKTETVVKTSMATQTNTEIQKPIGVKTPPQGYKNLKQITYDTLKKYNITINENSYQQHSLISDVNLKRTIEKEIEQLYGRSDLILFNPLDITEISNLTIEQLESIIHPNLNPEEMAQKLYDIEHSDKPVNAVYILAKMKNESSNPKTQIVGESNLAKYKNNLFGMGAYDTYKEGFEKYIETKDEKYKSDFDNFGKSYASKLDSVDALVNDYLWLNYLPEDGQYYNGRSMCGVNVKYTSSVMKSYKLDNEIREIEKKLGLR